MSHAQRGYINCTHYSELENYLLFILYLLWKPTPRDLKLRPFRYYQFETGLNIIKKDTSPYLQFKYHYTINLFEIFQVFKVFWVWQ